MWFGKNKKQNSSGLDELIGGSMEDASGKIKNLSVIDHLVDGILFFDEKNQLSLVNSQAEKILGVKKKEVLGRSVLKLNFFPAFQSLVSILGGDIQEISKKDLQLKENLILEVTTIPMVTEGVRIGTIVVLRDVTREKMVESMKSEFVTVAAHQLRTPTSGIKWSLQMLLDGDIGPLSKEQKDIIEKACETNDKVIHLINDLLNVARIEEGKYLNNIALVSFGDIVQTAMLDYKEEIKKRGLSLEFLSPENLPKVMVDTDKMQIAVSNLLDNAVRYTPRGGKITVAIEKKDEEWLEVKIQDTGAGISPNQQNKVFTKFFRGDNIMKIETEGTGLGLFITKNIIDAHGGKIWFESELNKGTAFYFLVPIKERFAEFIPPELY